jgi:hypothetical protein
LLAKLVDPVFLVKSNGPRLQDQLLDAIEPWLDGGSDQMVALGEILLAEEACRVKVELEGSMDLNWRRISVGGISPAFRSIGRQEAYYLRQTLKRLLQMGGGKGFR